MKMTIDEIIVKEKEIADEFQNTVDTHMVNSGHSLEEMYCDDTEVIEENLKRCKKLSDYHNTIANTMRKYQKIKEQVDIAIDKEKFAISNARLIQIREIINGNND